jgi:hypothetical protein
MDRRYLGLIEAAVVFSAALGWGVMEWVASRLGRHRDEASGTAASPGPTATQSDPATDSREHP